MKLCYIANIRLPTEKAHGIQVMKMCEAFAAEGLEVELVVPRRFNPINTNPFDYYGVNRSFQIKRLPSIDLVFLGKVGFWIQALSFAEFAAWYAFFKKNYYFFTRDEITTFYLRNLGKKVVWEAHRNHKNLFVRAIIKCSVPIVTISGALKSFFIGEGASDRRILVAPDGVDLGQFQVSLSQEQARKRVGLSGHNQIVMFAGHLYEFNGANILADAASLLPPPVSVIFLGGTERDVEKFKEKYENIKNVYILGKKPYTDVPYYLKSADILILPYSGKSKNTQKFMSPMKLFEYMASGVPIVSSDLSSLREILDDSTTTFFAPDSPGSLANAIGGSLEARSESQAKAKKALEVVKKYSWLNRANKIKDFFNNEYDE